MLAYNKSPGSKISKKYHLQNTQQKSFSQNKQFNYSEYKKNERQINYSQQKQSSSFAK